ncbi:hypothetical protein BDZ85DRAFT_258885 [Elsinoe ampelina]|uniref:Aminoglycoside phosphotransferase domain-containing protein n=1 Tax=Elsinoe ampelina TaxID=302913 RepID=A0A6A6GG41_9PEZI|nr:hypothetical protein BDZ85DRAFT_258885 [Elsinoe ampelina]
MEPSSPAEKPRLVEWIRNFLSWEPRWVVEPDASNIERTVKQVPGFADSDKISLEFLAQGAFNKLWTVTRESSRAQAIMRVTLPVDPTRKTASEVATLRWLLMNASLPVPKVLAFDAGTDNAIGFEWILMSKIEGSSLRSVWRITSLDAKIDLAKRLADYCSDAFTKQFRGIGSIYLRNAPSPDDRSQEETIPKTTYSAASSSDAEFQIRDMVAREFVWQDRAFQNLDRGPFSCTKDWMLARLGVAELACRERLDFLHTKKNQKENAKSQQERHHDLGNVDADEESRVDATVPANSERNPAGENGAVSNPGARGASVDLMNASNDNGGEDVEERTQQESESKGEEQQQQKDNEQMNGKDDNDAENESDEGDEDEDDDDHEDDIEECEMTLALCSRLRPKLSQALSTMSGGIESTMLWHDDLTASNTMVDERGRLTGVVDWECVSCLPLWYACQYPNLLRGADRQEAPDIEIYGRTDDGRVENELYWEDLEDFELTQMRRAFLERMERVQPEWVATFRSNDWLHGWDMAVSAVDDTLWMKRLGEWMDDMEACVEPLVPLADR